MLGLAIMALMMAVAQPAEDAAPPPPSKRIVKLLESADGKSQETAYKVRSIDEEYQILSALGLRPGSQALVTPDRGAFDVITAVDPRSGEERKVWFDISSFYGKGF